MSIVIWSSKIVSCGSIFTFLCFFLSCLCSFLFSLIFSTFSAIHSFTLISNINIKSTIAIPALNISVPIGPINFTRAIAAIEPTAPPPLLSSRPLLLLSLQAPVILLLMQSVASGSQTACRPSSLQVPLSQGLSPRSGIRRWCPS